MPSLDDLHRSRASPQTQNSSTVRASTTDYLPPQRDRVSKMLPYILIPNPLMNATEL